MTTARGAAFAAAHRMIDGVHGDAALMRTLAEPAGAAGLADGDVRVIDVGHLADGGLAVLMDHADLAGRHTDLRVRAVLRHQRRTGSGRANELSALALPHLDVVDHRAERDVPERHRVARLDVRVAARDDLVADEETVGREDVRLLAVCVVEEGDARGAVGIVLDRRDRRRHADLRAAPVDEAVALLVSTTAEAARDAPVRVAAARLGLAFAELLLRQ